MVHVHAHYMYISLYCALQEESLQQKVDFEVKMRDGTAKLLAASKHPNQLLEAAKSLLASNARMITYMAELQRMKFSRAFQPKP